MELTPRSKPFTKEQLEEAWTAYSSPRWIHEQSDAFIELECLKSLDCPVAMPVSEIAEKTGLTEQGVKEIIRSAFNKIRNTHTTV